MSEAKFTNGPWHTEYRKDLNGMYHQEVFDSAGKSICHCCWYPVKISSTVTGTNRKANAHLIAAAPEMYELLREMIPLCQTSEQYIKVEELLAKARGEL